jgi:hypothetical protein
MQKFGRSLAATYARTLSHTKVKESLMELKGPEKCNKYKSNFSSPFILVPKSNRTNRMCTNYPNI